MNANERFEQMAAEFDKETGFMAPGKDDCRGIHSYEERMAAWEKWTNAYAARFEASALANAHRNETACRELFQAEHKKNIELRAKVKELERQVAFLKQQKGRA